MFHTVVFDVTMSWELPNYHPSSLIGGKCSCGDGCGNVPGDCSMPGLMSPGVSDQAQGYHPASLSSESGESLRHTVANMSRRPVQMVTRSPCAGDETLPYGKKI
jgi:hypothetical protein